ncbi:MAG TPA: ferritin family protein [bacterium]|jgi:rubrerythrin
MNGKLTRKQILDMIKVLDKAINLEYNAQRFYANLALTVLKPQCREIFDWLSDFEGKHYKKLMRIRNNYSASRQVKGQVPDVKLTNEAEEMAGLFKEVVCMPAPEILKTAIENEKISYGYYQRKVTHASDPEVRDTFSQAAEEENMHILVLQKLLKMIDTGKSITELNKEAIVASLH